MADLNFQINVQGNAGEAVGSLKKQLREAQQEVVALSDKFGATSAEAVKAAKRAAELRDRIGDAKALTDSFNPDAKFKALTSSLAGVAGGFAAVQGAIGLFGAESKNVEKALLKVQSAMALSQGLQAIGESIDSFKNLKTVVVDVASKAFGSLKAAIISTGIGALVIGLGLLIANFDKVKKAVLNFIPGLAQVGEFFGKLVDTVTDFIGVTSEAERQLEKMQKTTLRGNEAIQSRIKVLQAQGGKEKEIYEQSQKLIENDLNVLRKTLSVKGELTEEEQKTFRELTTEREILRINETKRIQQENAKQAEERKKRIEEAKKVEEEYQRWSKDARDKRKQDLAKIQEDLDKEEQDRKEQQEKADEDFLERLGKRGEISLDIATKTADATFEINKQQLLNERAIIDARIAAQNEFAFAVASIFGNLSNVFAQGTAASKAAGLAEVAIQTGVGFANGLRIAQESAKGTGPAAAFAFPIFYATQIAAVLAAVGKAKSILSTVKGGGTTSNVTAPSFGTAPVAPQLPQTATTNISAQSINALGNQAIKAYVVETDVTSNQQRIKAIQQRARFD